MSLHVYANEKRAYCLASRQRTRAKEASHAHAQTAIALAKELRQLWRTIAVDHAEGLRWVTTICWQNDALGLQTHRVAPRPQPHPLPLHLRHHQHPHRALNMCSNHRLYVANPIDSMRLLRPADRVTCR